MEDSKVEELKLCENCKKEVSAVNFLIHNAHCQRNITLCRICNEPFPKSEISAHINEAHSKVKCAKCGNEIERQETEKHDADQCTKRMVRCGFCDIEVQAASQIEHEDYCGSRTERCDECGQYVMLKYRDIHISSNHSFLTMDDFDKRNAKHGASSTTSLYSGLKNFNTNKDEKEPLSIQPCYSPGKRTNDMPQINVNVNTGRPKETNKPIIQELYDARTTSAPADPSSMSMEQLDRLLAMHLAEDDILSPYAGSDPEDAVVSSRDDVGTFAATEDFDDPPSFREEVGHFGFHGRTPAGGTSGAFVDDRVILPTSQIIQQPDERENMCLPCEFCNALYSADQLLEHQRICEYTFTYNNPTRNMNSNIADMLFDPILNNSRNVENTSREATSTLNNLVKVPNAIPEPLGRNDFSDEVMIPCEYCGTLFDSEYIIEHQTGCGFLEDTPVAPPPRPAVDRDFIPEGRKSHDKIQTGETFPTHRTDPDMEYLDDIFLKEAIENSLKDKKPSKSSALEADSPSSKVRHVPIEVDADYVPRRIIPEDAEAQALDRVRNAKAVHSNGRTPLVTARRYDTTPSDAAFSTSVRPSRNSANTVDATGARPKSFARRAEADSTTMEEPMGGGVDGATEKTRTNGRHLSPQLSQGTTTTILPTTRLRQVTGTQPMPRPVPPRNPTSKQQQH